MHNTLRVLFYIFIWRGEQTGGMGRRAPNIRSAPGFDSCLLFVKWSNPMSYLWHVIIYLSDYFVNYLSIELLIRPRDKRWIMHDLIWDYCIQMPHCCGARTSHVEIKSPSQAILSSFETEAETGCGRTSACYQNMRDAVYPNAKERSPDLLHAVFTSGGCLCLSAVLQ